jgi:hypothetical protein
LLRSTPKQTCGQKAAESRRETAYWKAQTAQTVRGNLETTASMLETERQAVEAQLREAIEYADTDKLIQAQRQLTNIEARQRQNDYALHQANSRPSDPVEAYAQGRHERAASWIRRHPQFVTDPRLNHKTARRGSGRSSRRACPKYRRLFRARRAVRRTAWR